MSKISLELIHENIYNVFITNWDETNKKLCQETHQKILQTIQNTIPKTPFLLLNFSSVYYQILDLYGIVSLFF